MPSFIITVEEGIYEDLLRLRHGIHMRSINDVIRDAITHYLAENPLPPKKDTTTSWKPKCIRPNQENILQFLRQYSYPQTPQTVDHIRFALDTAHGCVWRPSRVLSTLKKLQEKGLVHEGPDGWTLERKN